MPIQKYDMTFAMKAIGLSEQLNAADKRVAFAILDHYNRRTGRCDPSRETLGKVLNVAERTISRANAKFTKTGLFKVIRHGGHYNCNSYEPNWQLYRTKESDWMRRRAACSRNFADQDVASHRGQNGPQTDDKPVNQTLSTNTIQPTSTRNNAKSPVLDRPQLGRWNMPLAPAPSPRVFNPATSSAEAAKAAAEKRWNADLVDRYGKDPAVYGQFIEKLDPALQEAVTQAELQRRGSGLAYLLKTLSDSILTVA